MNGENGTELGDRDPTTWVLLNIQRISKLIGVSFEGLEEQAMNLLKEIEKTKQKGIEAERYPQ